MTEGSQLLDQLQLFANHAGRRLWKVARRSNSLKPGGIRPSRQEFDDACLSAAFLAFLDAGGDPDAPEGFDWNDPEAFTNRTIQYMRVWLAEDTCFRDGSNRHSLRKLLAPDQCWDAWWQPCERKALEYLDIPHRDRGLGWGNAYVSVHHTFVDAHLVVSEAESIQDYRDRLWQDVDRVLTPHQAVLVRAVYIDGWTVTALARQRLEQEGRDVTPQSMTRMETAMYVQLHRARHRLVERLPYLARFRALLAIPAMAAAA